MIYTAPGQTFEAAVTGFPPGLEGTIRVGIYAEPSRTSAASTAPTTVGIVEDNGVYGKTDLVAPATGGRYWLIWDQGPSSTNPAIEELVVSYTSPVSTSDYTFASPDDVAARLGRDLTDGEVAQVDFLLLAATEVIVDAVDKDLEWAQGLDVPLTLRFVCAEMVVRSMNFAPGVQSTTESLGAYSFSERAGATGEGGGLWLSKLEQLMVRRTVWGTTSGSARVGSFLDDVYYCP